MKIAVRYFTKSKKGNTKKLADAVSAALGIEALDVSADLTEKADEQAIRMFGQNLKPLLMQPPVKGKTVLAVDPALVDWAAVEDMRLKPVSDELEATGFKTVSYKGVSIPLVRPVLDITDNGWIGPDHPNTATEAWGRDMLDACARYIADFMEAFRRAPLPEIK